MFFRSQNIHRCCSLPGDKKYMTWKCIVRATSLTLTTIANNWFRGSSSLKVCKSMRDRGSRQLAIFCSNFQYWARACEPLSIQPGLETVLKNPYGGHDFPDADALCLSKAFELVTLLALLHW